MARTGKCPWALLAKEHGVEVVVVEEKVGNGL